MEEILLKIEGLSKSFGENQVLKNINMEVRTGEIIGLVGENGAGKSTLMKIIFGMPVIASTGGYNGKILFQGKEINFSSSFDALESGIGMVHQEFSLIPGFTASENIVLNRETTNKSIFKELFGEKLNQLNMEKIEERATVAFSHLRVQINPETVVSE
ncbi:MAG: ATP-binding cassette domain-containing protein, partial [Lachnospiraceae bacterium]